MSPAASGGAAKPLQVTIDIGILGGGIAGLWLLARLRGLGYSAHLFERRALGGGGRPRPPRGLSTAA